MVRIQDTSEQCLKLFNETGIFYNTAYRKRLDWVIARYSYLALSVTHGDVFTLTDYLKISILKSANRNKMVNTW